MNNKSCVLFVAIVLLCIVYSVDANPTFGIGIGGVGFGVGYGISPFAGGFGSYGGYGGYGYPGYGYGGWRRYRYPHFYPPIAVLAG